MSSLWRRIFPDISSSQNSDYHLVNDAHSQDEKHNLSADAEPGAHSLKKRVTAAAALTLAIAIPAIFIVYMIASSPGSSQTQGLCGNSSAEALARGCSFDQLMWAWYPNYCPHYANKEYLAAGSEDPWRFYIDPHERKLASQEEWVDALDNKVSVYGEKREHLSHCVYMYLSLGQILRDGTRYTPRQVDYEHIEHCAGMMLEALSNSSDWYEVQTKAPTVFYDQDC